VPDAVARELDRLLVERGSIGVLAISLTWRAPDTQPTQSKRRSHYHQDFMTRHPGHPYIVYNDLPKIDGLKRLFPDAYRVDPELVAAARSTN
jgi:hypothetical protein